MLGQESDQSSNPFSIGEKIIVAVLPHERTNKLMAKWKGPFTVTKVPNRFEIEYLDDGLTRLTHISYAKKFNERCQNFAREGMPREQRVSRVKQWARMARIRLIYGTGDAEGEWWCPWSRPSRRNGLSSREGSAFRCWGMEPFLQICKPL